MIEPKLVKRIDLNDQVYVALRDWIVSGELRPEERLSLQRLAERLDVSRSPVHHALTRLVNEGLVSVRSRYGYFVTPLTAKVVEDAYDVRLSLELMAAERTVGCIAEEALAQLRWLMEATLPPPAEDVTTVDPRPWHRANQTFHEYQIDLADNPVASEIFRRLSVNLLMERLVAGRKASWLPQVAAEHVELVEAFEAADLARVQQAIRRHSETGRTVALDALASLGGSG
jgi:DNA-binding GntR family transcriptional regulator